MQGAGFRSVPDELLRKVFEQEKTERAEPGIEQSLCFLLFKSNFCPWLSAGRALPDLPGVMKLMDDAVKERCQTPGSSLGVWPQVEHVLQAFRAFEERR